MRALAISVGGTRVGLLEQLEDWDHRFSFDPTWLEMPARPVLGQLFEDRRPHDIVTSGLPCWFTHLLPQGALRRALEKQLGEDADAFDLLGLVGQDLPGAVAAEPAEPSLRPLANRPVPAPRSLQATGDALFFSLAGAQWKLSVREGERGLVVPVRGETGMFIAKFHDPAYPGLPRIEHATMEWAHLSGIDIPPFRMVHAGAFQRLPEGIPTGTGEVFVIERFDRTQSGTRIHMEDFGQILDRPPGPSQYHGSHEDLGVVLGALAPADVRAFCERIAFCAVAGNGDAHLKNWTMIYPDGRSARLSPAYDLVATVVYPSVDDHLALELGGSRRFEDVTERSFEGLAEVVGTTWTEVATWARDAATRARAVFDEHGTHLPLTDDERRRLTTHLTRVPLGR